MSKSIKSMGVISIIILLILATVTLSNFFVSLISQPFTDTDVIIAIINGTVGICSAAILAVIAFMWTRDTSKQNT